MKEKKSTKIITVLTVVFAIIAFLGILSRLLLKWFLSNKFNVSTKSIKDASSIGIIGGADGPTSIILSSSNHSTLFMTIISGILAVIGIIYLIRTKKSSKR